MLVDFRVKNFRIFKDDVILSMIPDEDIHEMEYSLNNIKIEDVNMKGLSTALIYGPNGIGKTSLIQAITLLKEIILNHSLNLNKDNSINSQILQFPNIYNSEKQEIEFEINFINNDKYFNFELHIDVGNFGDRNLKSQITFEKLEINDQTVYERIKDQLKTINPDFLLDSFKDIKGLSDVISSKLKNDKLFLTEDNLIIKDSVLDDFYDWFKSKLIIKTSFNSEDINSNFNNNENLESPRTVEEINQLHNQLDTSSNRIVFYSNKNEPKRLLSLVKPLLSNNEFLVNCSEFESAGTQRIIKLFPLIIKALKTGATLIYDQLDTSIHSTFIMSLINVFHDDEINKQNAQLIMTTHNPIYMSQKLVRRDEIVFLDRDDNHNIDLYTLSDFPAVKSDDNFLDTYLQEQYGAINIINLNEIVLNTLKNENKESLKKIKEPFLDE